MVGSRERAYEAAARGTVVASIVGGDRFRIEVGRSGRRHVFSRVDGPIEAADLVGAVVVLRECGGGRRLWVGPGDRAPLDGPSAEVEIFAHWIAETAAARAGIVADLGPTPVRGAPIGATGLAA